MPEFIELALAPNYIGYEEAWDIQRRIHSEVSSGKRDDTVLLLEHSAVYTAGKRTDDIELPKDGSPVIETDRGQLVGYPIMQLPRPIDVVGYVRWLEQVLIDSIAEFGLTTERVEGRSGVWAKTGDSHVKVAAIGIRVSEHTTMHGFALNCNNSLEPYETIIACGIADAKTSTLSELLGREITPTQAAEVIKRHLGKIGKVEL
jgi:lipoyl(octanoyl) transferase